MIKLGVNVDHVATVRQARGGKQPDPLLAALMAEQAGADGITVHLREDRRHIQERDVELLLQSVTTKVNLEMATREDMVSLACKLRPAACCLVPEKRAELTTEGGLDLRTDQARLAGVVQRLLQSGIRVSAFIDPDLEQIAAAVVIGVPVVELHTGAYADAKSQPEITKEWQRLQQAAVQGRMQGLVIHAGHGLNYHNVQKVVAIGGIEELNIGHAIIARAIMVGMHEAVLAMKQLMREAVMWGNKAL